VQLQAEHPTWVRDLAFVCWVECDRNASRAVALLEERWPEGEPYRAVPYRSLCNWVERGNWHAKADDLIAQTFPGLRMRQLAMLVAGNSRHIQTINDIASGAYNDTTQYDPRSVRNMLEAAKVGLIAGGLGTFGSRDRTAPVVRQQASDEAIDFSNMSAQELARWEADLIARSRNDGPDERRR
jgi:hypothetical protein